MASAPVPPVFVKNVTALTERQSGKTTIFSTTNFLSSVPWCELVRILGKSQSFAIDAVRFIDRILRACFIATRSWREAGFRSWAG